MFTVTKILCVISEFGIVFVKKGAIIQSNIDRVVNRSNVKLIVNNYSKCQDDIFDSLHVNDINAQLKPRRRQRRLNDDNRIARQDNIIHGQKNTRTIRDFEYKHVRQELHNYVLRFTPLNQYSAVYKIISV